MSNKAISITIIFLSLIPYSVWGSIHSADVSQDGQISLSELLRVIQFYNSPGYSCAGETEDGYIPRDGDRTCQPHDSDYSPQDWSIGLSELLRLIQLYNSDRYRIDKDSEDGFSPCSYEDLDPHLIPVPGDYNGNFLTDEEENALGISVDPGEMSPPIGILLALAASAAIQDLAVYNVHGGLLPPPEENDPYLLVLLEYDCGCTDPFTGEYIPLVGYELVDPVSDIRIPLREAALHFLSYGSFSYLDASDDCGECVFNGKQVRIDTIGILSVLGIEP